MSAPSPERLRTTGLLPYAEARLEGYLTDLAHLVAIDSGSYSPEGVNRMADWTQERLLELGFDVDRIAPAPTHGHPVGDMLVARSRGDLPVAEGGRRVLLVAHLDTVFEDGTAAERPFALHGRTARGL
ncbi:M20 family peptidase, partial [Streptomyces xiamenensis]